MPPGDEILSINIEITRSLSVSTVREILSLAVDCPVRLTLRGKRRPSSSVPVVHGSNIEDQHLIQTTSRADNSYYTTSERHSARRRSSAGSGSATVTEHRSSRLSAGLTRWISEPINITERPENNDDFTEIEGSLEEVFHTYPTYRGLNVDTLPERASSLTDVKLHDSAARGAETTSLSPAVRSAVSDDKLYVRVDAIGAGTMNDSRGLYAKSYSTDCQSSDSPGFVSITEEDTGGQVEGVACQVPDRVSNDNDSTIDVDSYVKIERSDFDDDDNDNLDRALAAGRQQPNRAGLDKALRVKEKETRGGMAYYVDLEPYFNDVASKQHQQ